MAGINEAIVREFFELRGFLVRQLRKFVGPSNPSEEEADFAVVNPRVTAPRPAAELPFVLGPEDLDGVAAGVVAIRGWHTGTFSAAQLAADPELERFTHPTRLAQTAATLGITQPLVRIVVVPSLPQSATGRTEATHLLRQRGVDAILPFRAVLGELLVQTEANRNYAKSDILQVIRILKNYDLLKDPSLELFRPRRARKKP